MMSHYELDIHGDISLYDYSSISDYLALIERNDNFGVMFSNVTKENIDIVCSMIREKNFTLISIEDKNGKTFVKAQRNKICY